MVLKKEVINILRDKCQEMAKTIILSGDFFNALYELIPEWIAFDQVDRMKTHVDLNTTQNSAFDMLQKINPDECSQSTQLVQFMMHRTDDEFIKFCKVLIAVGQRGVVEKYFSECLELLGTTYNVLLDEVSPSQADTSQAASAAPSSAYSADPPQGYDAEKMHLDVTDYHYKVQVKKSTKKFYEEKREQGQHMTTAASTSVTVTGIHEEGRPSGETVSESTWHFEISNKADHLKSGSILPYPMEIFVPTGALPGITELKVTVTQMTNDNPPSRSKPGNRKLGPIIRLKADQAHIQFVRPLLVLVRFPEEFLKHTDDYEYCVQYNSDKKIHDGTWSDITGYHEGKVSGEVIPSHQTAVLLLPHFCCFAFGRMCKMMTVELFGYPSQLQNNCDVWVTCLVYPKSLRDTEDYKAERERIKGEYNTSENIDVSKRGNEEAISLTAVGHESEQWRLKNENLGTQTIPIEPLLEDHIMQKHFVFQGQGQLKFSCHIEAIIPGCNEVNPPVQIPLPEQDQAVKNPSTEHGNDAGDDSLGSVQTVKNTKTLLECIPPGYFQHLKSKDRDCLAMGPVLNKKVKDVMIKHIHDLATDIKPTPELYNSLYKWIPDCLLPSQVDRIKKSHPDECSQAMELDQFMKHRTNDEFIKFCKVLIAVKQRGVVEKYFSECLVLLGTTYNVLLEEVSPSQADTSQAASAAPSSAHSTDPPQGYDAKKMHLDVTDDHYKVQVKKSTKKFYGEKREQAYPMNTKKKGFALVINVQRVEGQEERTGTDIDRNKIVFLLQQLDFQSIKVYNDKDDDGDDQLTHEDILDKVKAFAMEVHKEARRVVVFILSHGDSGGVYGTDGKTVPVKKLLHAVNHERLAGIPKMVAFQACRGDMMQDTTDSIDAADLITCYSTKEGYVSWRNKKNGSWFIAALVQIFGKHAHQLEIRELMAKVKTEVGNRTSLTDDAETSGKLQTPETEPNLSKDWFLFPGYPDF